MTPLAAAIVAALIILVVGAVIGFVLCSIGFLAGGYATLEDSFGAGVFAVIAVILGLAAWVVTLILVIIRVGEIITIATT